MEKKKSLIQTLAYRFWNLQESSIILLTVLYVAIVQIINPVFLGMENVINMLRSTAYLLIPSLGMTFVLISGNIDLSVCTVMGMGGILCCMFITAGIPILVSVILALLIAVVTGFINGYLVTKFSIPPMIMTLGMQYIAKGVVYVLTQGRPIYPLPDEFLAVDKIYLGEIPIIVIVALLLSVVCHVILRKTRFGRETYAVGGNRESARMSGISQGRTVILCFVISALMAVFAGITMAARVGSAQSSTGTGYELNAIVACLIGGTSINGGTGGVIGTIFGALFIEVLKNGLLMMRVNVYWQQLLIGIVVVLAVIWDQYRRMLQIRKL